MVCGALGYSSFQFKESELGSFKKKKKKVLALKLATAWKLQSLKTIFGFLGRT